MQALYRSFFTKTGWFLMLRGEKHEEKYVGFSSNILA
jgi:hypothetical protein